MRDDAYDHTFKLLLIGDSGVGKSSLLLRFTDGTFEEDIGTTIGVDFKVKVLNVRNKQRVKLTIWDTAGQERFRTLTSSYYRGAQGVVLVYDISSAESFDHVKQWMAEVQMYTTVPDVITLLVGNKVDKRAKEDAVPRATAEAFAREHGLLFIECSARTKEGVQQAFEELVNKILDTPSLLANTSATAALNLANAPAEASGGGLCC